MCFSFVHHFCLTLDRVLSDDMKLFCGFYTFALMQGDELKVKVNKLTSTKTQLPYSYYSLPYCKPDRIVDSAENLGEVLRGDRIENSPYVVSLCFSSNLLIVSLFLVDWLTKFIFCSLK